jgi:DNA-binding NarL/FixJ family response regulator
MKDTSESTSIVIADDHPVFRTGLDQIIGRAPGLDVVAACGDGREAIAKIRELQPQVAVLDVHMPKMSGLEVSEIVHKEHLRVSILILTMFDDEFMFDAAMEHGVLGYILKDSASQDIVRGIKSVSQGRYFVSPSLTDGALRKRNAQTAHPLKHMRIEQLTPTEKRIIHFVAENMKTSEISEELRISSRTVDRHRENICHKLELSGPYALLRFALHHRGEL